jgi:pantoate--beta-alanine ligase
MTIGERRQALCIPRALQYCRQQVEQGERDAMKLLGEMANIVAEQPDMEIDYIAAVDAHTLEDVAALKGDILVAIAAKIGTTRLIDNVRFEGLKAEE